MAINHTYASLQSHRFVIKIALIGVGVAIAVFFCGLGSLDASCFGLGETSTVNSFNALTLLLDIVFLILNLLVLSQSGTITKIEYIYSIIAAILLLVATCIMIWYFIHYRATSVWWIVSTVLIVVKFALYVRDVHILHHTC
ncbi:Protein M60.4 b [Aphelenchoides avenae]|nr:Protein M60.4 b [Aphelenchus avenae]KAH7708612.1 Protein M60.4 b [Aphelenchus avenae]